ncbi:unnamed protein product [Meloidogyne enterolobii]|uniref:Uncharacterized protein n=1 Tax=Meloidogyne enterolobii TaxID=390850 RepID=A0ACB0XQK1_MELEN
MDKVFVCCYLRGKMAYEELVVVLLFSTEARNFWYFLAGSASSSVLDYAEQRINSQF